MIEWCTSQTVCRSWTKHSTRDSEGRPLLCNHHATKYQPSSKSQYFAQRWDGGQISMLEHMQGTRVYDSDCCGWDWSWQLDEKLSARLYNFSRMSLPLVNSSVSTCEESLACCHRSKASTWRRERRLCLFLVTYIIWTRLRVFTRLYSMLHLLWTSFPTRFSWYYPSSTQNFNCAWFTMGMSFRLNLSDGAHPMT